MIAEYNVEPTAVQYMQLPNGQADVWLRKDITETIQEATDESGSSSQIIWTVDEVYFRTTLSLAEVEENFDSLFETYSSEVEVEDVVEITTEERLDSLEAAVLELAEVVAEAIG